MFIKGRFFYETFLMNDAGGGDGGAGSGGAAAGGEGAGNATADGTGGKAALFQSGGDGKPAADSIFVKTFGNDLAANKGLEKYAKSENPAQDVAKAYLDLQTKIGQPRYDVPDDKAPDDVKAAFWQKLGVPEKADGYGFKKPDNLPEGMAYDEAHAAKWAETFKKLNVPAAQANALRTAFFEEIIALHGTESAAAAEAGKRLDEHYTKAFGDKKGEIAARVSDTLKAAIPDDKVREDLSKALPDEALLAIGLLDQHYRKTYGQADQNMNDNASGASKTPDEMREDAMKIMASPEYRDPMHKDHKATREKVDQIYKNIAGLTAAAKKK